MFRLLTFAVVALCSALLLPPEASATAQFSGHVFDSDGHPVAGANVRAGYNTFVPFSWLFLTAGQAITAADGSYEIDDLSAQPPAFSYWIVASAAGRTMSVYANHPCYWPEGCLGSFQMQGVVDSVQPPASGLDFTLRHAVEISGRVSVAATDTPISYALLTLLHHESGTYIYPGVDAAGHYDITGLQPGSYTAFVEPGSDDLISQAYAGFDYDASMDQEQVDAGTTLLPLAEGQSAVADFALHAASHISGTLTSALDGAPITSDISVHRVDAPDGTYRTVGSGTGAYSIKLAQGSFDIRFDKDDWWTPYFTTQPISVGTGESVTGIDVQLMPRNAFEGQVTDAATHQPVAGARVLAGPESIIGVLPQVTAISDASG
ncbi:MAG: carboxypeptidase-like regulatory domain-containing protein [Dokdonella sp.]